MRIWGVRAIAAVATGVLAGGLLATVPAATRTAPAAAATYDHTYNVGCGPQGVTDLVHAFKDIGGYWTHAEMQGGRRLAQNGERDLIVLAENCTYDFGDSFDGATALPSLDGGFYGTNVKVTIEGRGATFARTGSARYRFLAVAGTGSELTIDDLTFSGGAAPHGAGLHADPFMTKLCGPLGGISGCSNALADRGGDGGAIANVGTLRLSGVTFTGNRAGNGHQGDSNNPRSRGGSGGAGGAVYSSPGSWLIVDDSTFTGNQAGAGGQGANSGRPFAAGGVGGNGGPGGALAAFGHLQITRSTFRANLVGDPGRGGTHFTGQRSPGGLYGGGAAVAIHGAPAPIDASSFIDNGHLGGHGGAVEATSPVTITNSTFQRNGASYGGAISTTGTEVTVHNSTFVGNYTDNTGDVVAGAYGGTVELANSVIVPPASGEHVACSTTTAGYEDDGVNANTPLTYELHSVWANLAHPGGCAGDSSGATGLPASPALNGGATLSFAPSDDSDLRDAGDPAYCPTHDQSGLPRDTSDGGCDIGSVDHFTWPATTITGPELDPERVAQHGYPDNYKGITQSYAWAYYFDAPVITDAAARYRLRVFSGGGQRDYAQDENGDPLRDLSLLPITFDDSGPVTAELWVGAVGQWLKVATVDPFRVLLADNSVPTLSVSVDGGTAAPYVTSIVDEFSTHHYDVTVTDPDDDASWSFAQAPSCGERATLSDLTVTADSFAFDCTYGAGGPSTWTQITATVVDDQFDRSAPAQLGVATIVDRPTRLGTLTGPAQIPIDTTAHYSFTITDGHEDLVALAADPTWEIVCGRHLSGPANTQTSVDGTTLTTTFDCTSDGTGLGSFNRMITEGGVIIHNDATHVVFDPEGGSGPPTVHHTRSAAYYVVSQADTAIHPVYEVGDAVHGNVLLGRINHPAIPDIARTRIDWGDGTVETFDGWAGSTGPWVTYAHPYATPGQQTVTVSVETTAEPGTWIDVVTADLWDYDSATPVLSLPEPVTLSNAVPGQSDRLYYTATASDPINGTYAATCQVAKGATVPVGTRNVQCSATGNGQTVTGTFAVTVRDVQPPVIGTPTISQDRQGDGVHVHLDVPFTDDAPATGQAVCDPSSDSVFAQGTTLVVCTATDAAGNTAKTSFAVAVADGTGPVLHVPSSATGSSPDGSGVEVSFSVTATGVAGDALTPTCTPASGSVFPPGTTIVSCAATDAGGNVTVGDFPVVVSGGTVATWSDLDKQFEYGGGIVAGRRTVTVKLSDDIVVETDSDGVGDQLQLGADDEATIDLAGHDLSIDAPYGLPAIGVPTSAELRVIDSVGGGRLTLSAHAGAAAIGGGICQSAGDVSVIGVAGSAVSYADGRMTGGAGIGSGAQPDAATLENWGGAIEVPGDCSAALDGGTVTVNGASHDGAPTTVSAPASAVGAAVAWTPTTGGTTPIRLSRIHVAGESDGIAFTPSGWLTVDLQGGTSSDAAPGGPLAAPGRLALAEPSRDGYFFGGWRKGSPAGPAWAYSAETAATDPESQTSFTVYASWIPLVPGADCSQTWPATAPCQLVLEPGDDLVLDIRGEYWFMGAYDGSSDGPGIELPPGATLTVVDSAGGGLLDAVGGDGAAGIGGDAGQGSGTLVVRNASVQATGRGGAGVGGGVAADGGALTISGGYLAGVSEPWSAGQPGAGIGAGDGGTAGGTFTIRGSKFAEGDAPVDTAPGEDAPGATISVEPGAQQYDGASGPEVGTCLGEPCYGFYVQLGHPATFHLNGGDAGEFPQDGATQLLGPLHATLRWIQPALEGSDFAGWYLDAELTERVRDRVPFEGPVDLYAKYVASRPAITAETAPVFDTDAFRYYGTPLTVTPPSGLTGADDVTVHYQWMRCTRVAPVTCAEIGGAADKPTYTPRLADLDRQLKVRVTATADGATPYAWTSGATRTVQTGKFIPAQGTYTNFGGPTVGQALAITLPSWNEVPQRIDYVWQRNGTPIAGAANTASYVARADDVGAALSVAITARGDGFDNWTFTAGPSGAVAKAFFTNAPRPTVAITPPAGSSDTTRALIGSRLTADAGDWPDGTTFDYQWVVNDGSGAVPIAGATDPTYTVPAGSTNDYFSVEVTGSAPGYHDKTMPSDSLRVPELDVETPQLKIDGSSGSCTGLTSQEALAMGQIVCVVVPDLPAGATLDYQWLRDGAPVTSVLGDERYYLDVADVDHTLTVAATVTAPGYDPVTVTSAPGFGEVWPVLNKTKPVLSGQPVVGERLTVSNGAWTWLPQRWTYTWLRDGDEIDGAGGSCFDGANCSAVNSYVLRPADGDHTITVSVEWRYDGAGGNPRDQVLDGTASALSNARGPVELAAQTSTPTPVVSGPAKVGTLLTAAPGTWDDGVDLSYEWRAGDEVVGSDSDELELSPSMVGETVTVAVTGTKAGYASATRTSSGVTVLEGDLSATPTPSVTGSRKVGTLLTASAGTWDDDVELSYEWRVDDEVVGDDSDELSLTPSMVGETVTVSVTGSKAGYAEATRTSTGVTVLEGDLGSTPVPEVSGSRKVGSVLTASAGAWDDGVDLAYEWRAGETVVGTDSPELSLVPSMVGETVTVAVTGTKTGYTEVTRTSSGVTVAEGDLAVTPAPVISGPGKVGTTLTATPGAWDDGVALALQWRDGDAVLGTGTTLALPATLVGRTITLAATGTKPGYASRTTSSTIAVAPGDLTPATPVLSTTAPAVGDTITVAPGTWGPDAVRTDVQWYADGAPIAQAASTSLTLGAAHVGKRLTALVTGSAPGYTTRTMSADTSPVRSGTITRRGTVTIKGTPKVGKKLTASPPTFTADTAKVTVKYQWLANGKPVKRATGSTYKIAVAQRGKKLSVRVTATTPGYSSMSMTSARTKKVAK